VGSYLKILPAKTPRILAVVENLSTSPITDGWLLPFEPGTKVLTVGMRAKSLVWRGLWRVDDVEKLRKALEKRAGVVRATKAKKTE
jgi:hypothetical protein